jgi:hypothetical protein
MDMTIIQPNLVDGAVLIICRIPSYSMPQWLVQIDDQTIRIESSNRVVAHLKARLLFPSAKRIRVVKQVKKRDSDIFIE